MPFWSDSNWLEPACLKDIVKMTKKCLIAIALSVFFTSAYAQSSPNPEQSGPASLPPSLLEACKGKKEKDSCTVTNPKNEKLEGTCLKLPNAPDTVACLPNPPKEIIEACSGKADSESCTIVAPDGKNISGKCRQSPLQEKEHLCIPNAPVGSHEESAPKSDK